MVGIGRNLNSAFAIRQLGIVSERLGTTFERLSSGQRINKASDDPAGLAVSSALSVKNKILNRAQINLSDAVSVLSMADSAMESVSGLLGRMTELAQQAAKAP